jgi:hypothetical protein
MNNTNANTLADEVYINLDRLPGLHLARAARPRVAQAKMRMLGPWAEAGAERDAGARRGAAVTDGRDNNTWPSSAASAMGAATAAREVFGEASTYRGGPDRQDRLLKVRQKIKVSDRGLGASKGKRGLIKTTCHDVKIILVERSLQR